MAKTVKSLPPVDQELFPPQSFSEARADYAAQLDELRLLTIRMQGILNDLDVMSAESKFHVQFVDERKFYSGVLLTLKL